MKKVCPTCKRPIAKGYPGTPTQMKDGSWRLASSHGSPTSKKFKGYDEALRFQYSKAG